MGAYFAAMHRTQVALPPTPEVTQLSLFVFGQARQREILNSTLYCPFKGNCLGALRL